MEVNKTYKVKLYPNKAQEAEMLKILAGCRFVWNYFLNARKDYYLENKTTLSFAEMSRMLTKLRKVTPEIQTIHLQILEVSLRRLDTAYNRFFRKLVNFPRFKSDFDRKSSFGKSSYWRIVDNRIQVQKNLVIKCRGKLPENVKKIGTVTISYEARSKWFASITTVEDVKVPKKHVKPIGIDVGLNALASVSNGEKYNVDKNQLHNQLALLQRQLTRQKIGSNRRSQTRKKIARLYHRIANKRLDNTHKVTNQILRKNPSLVAIEDLSVNNMVKNRRLARSIQNASWGEFFRQIEYKTKWRGGEVVKIDRFFPSSKTCHKCFYVADSLPLSIREWVCPQCKTHLDRDINSAKVILLEGQGMPRAEKIIG